MAEDQQIGDPIDKLYSTLKSRGYYTKSLADFRSQYSDSASINKLYSVVNRDGLYTKTRDEFYGKYYPTLKKKEPSLQGGADLSQTGGGVGTLISESLKTEAKKGKSGIAGGLSVPSTVPAKKEKLFTPDIAAYNKSFEDFTGHREFSLRDTPKSDNPLARENFGKKKEELDLKKYELYRGREENEINPTLTSISLGMTSPQQLSNLYEKPYGKKVIENALQSEVPELGYTALSKDVFGNEGKWDEISRNINIKNRPAGVQALNEQYYKLDQELNDFMKGKSVLDVNVSGGTGGGAASTSTVLIPQIDTNNPTEISQLISMIEGGDYLADDKGGKVEGGREQLLEMLRGKARLLSTYEQMSPEITNLSPKITEALTRVWMDSERGEKLQGVGMDDKTKQRQFEIGLNYAKTAIPGTYHNVIRAIEEKGKISDLDYEQLASIGQEIYNEQLFREGAIDPSVIGKETQFDHSTYQTKRAEYSRLLSEKIKSYGVKNKAKVSSSVIDKAAKELGLENEEIVNDLKRDEAMGGYGIVKGGGLTAFFRGIASPIKSTQTTINAIFDSPTHTYLNSKRLDIGDQKIFDNKGNVVEKLPSEKGKIFNDILEGTGQFITQIAFTRGVGRVAGAPFKLSKPQMLNVQAYGGGAVTTLAQTYGQEYTDFLQKTGDPSKARLMATVSSLPQAVIEVGILPDVKLAESMKNLLKIDARKMAQGIVKVVASGGGEDAAKPFITEFLKNAGKVYGKEILTEEVLQNATNFMTEVIFSPSTAKSRNLVDETLRTIREATVSFAIPTLLGAAGKTVSSRSPFTKETLHYVGNNFDMFKKTMDDALEANEVSKEDYDKAMEVATIHAKSYKDAPWRDAKGDVVSMNRQLEYAYQNTVQAINEKLAQESPDKIQAEPFTERAKEAEAIKRKIFYGETMEGLPKKEKEEVIEISPDEQLLTTLRSGSEELSNQDLPFFVDQASNAPHQFIEKYGEEVTQQLLDKATTEQLQKSLNDLIEISVGHPSIPILDKEITKRDTGKGEVTFKDARQKEEVPAQPQEAITEQTPEPTISVEARKTLSKLDKIESVLTDEDYADPWNSKNFSDYASLINEVQNEFNRGRKEGNYLSVARKEDREFMRKDLEGRIEQQSPQPKAITEQTGKENILYHGTDKDFDTFNVNGLGIHFGTKSQAADRGSRIIEATVSVKNPFRIDDPGSDFDMARLSGELLDAGLITKNKKDDLIQNGTPKDIRDILVKNGYDGIVYLNRNEGKASPQDSYIVFDNSQIKQSPQPKAITEEQTQTTQKEEGEAEPPTTPETVAPKNKEFHDKVDKAADSLIDALKNIPGLSAKLPKGTQQKGFDFEGIIRAGADIVKKAYDLGTDVKAAIEEAVKFIKDAFAKEGIDVDENIIRENLQSIDPPKPPSDVPPKSNEPPKGKPRRNDKGILTHLYEAENVPQAAKEGFLKEGLKYETKSQKEAQAVAESILDAYGIEDGVAMAEAQKFDGDVNSLIFAEALNRIAENEELATTPEEKLEHAKQFAEISIAYDKTARFAGRFNSAINYFYKKSPLGIVIAENVKRKDAFDEWSKSRDKSWKEYFDEMMKEPEFEEVVREKVKEAMMKERAESRKKRIEKVRSVFRKAKDQFKGGAAYSTIIPPQIITLALDAMEAAYLAGEAVVDVVQKGIDIINDKMGTAAWDKEKFRKEWEDKLKDGGKSPEEIKEKVLNRFRKKLDGLTDKQKEDVIRKSYKKIIESGGLDYDEFRKIIASVTGRGDLTGEEQTRIKELVDSLNSVEEAGERARTERTPEALKAFQKTEFAAGKAARELNEIFWNKPDIMRRLTSIMQLNTLGIPALINNPIYNLWNQMLVRFPIGIVNNLIDRVAWAVGEVTGRKYEMEFNTIEGQGEFWRKLIFGGKEAATQLFTGLNRQDYIQKEVYGQQIRPARALLDLFGKNRKVLTSRQKIDKAIQASPQGWIAEGIARLLNVGDKPQRFAAQGAQASVFAQAFGLSKGIDYDLFIEFPREEAYKLYKEKGMSDAEAGKKADYVRDTILKEGKRSTFQQDNWITDKLNLIFGGKDSGVGGFAKAITVSPFIKIPTNAFWSYYNLLNPEVAMAQAAYFAGKARGSRFMEDNTSRLAAREARYWFAHAVVGVSLRAVIIMLVKAGVFVPSSDDDESKKERDARSIFDAPGTMNMTKLAAILRGENPDEAKGGVNVSIRWFGQMGTVGNAIAKRYKDMDEEQRKNVEDFWNIAVGGMEIEGIREFEQSVFANSGALLSALNQDGSMGWERIGLNTIGLITNIIQPAAFAQLSRAQLPYYSTTRADNFKGQIKNAMLQRSSLFRKLTGQYPPAKITIWGERMDRNGSVLQRLFGVNVMKGDNWAQPIYEDVKKTGDTGFFPPAVLPTLGGKKLNNEQLVKLQEYVGKARKSNTAPFVNDQATIQGFNVKYSQLSPEDKKYVLTYMYNLGREEGVEKFKLEFPEFKTEEVPDYIKDIQKDLFKILQPYEKQR